MIPITATLSGIIVSGVQSPIGRIEIFATNFTYPSLGLSGLYCLSLTPGDETNGSFSSHDSIISFDWTKGIPVGLSPYTSDSMADFSVTWSGFFYARQTGNYRFRTRGADGIRIILNSTTVVTSPWGSTNPADTISEGYKVLTADTWYPIKIDYYSISNETASICSAFYTEPGSSEERLISASSTNTTKSFLSPILVANIQDINESVQTDMSHEMSFTVPLYTDDSQTQWIDSNKAYGIFKLGRLVKVYWGYKTPTGSEYILRMVGNIRSVSLNQNRNSQILTISCQDFSKKFVNAINENFPNRSSYTPEVINNIGLSTKNISSIMPLCYDHWRIEDAIKDLAIKAQVDPIYLSGLPYTHYRLTSNIQYPMAPGATVIWQSKPISDDGFIFQFPYGDKVKDCMNNLADLIGYTLYNNCTGDLIFHDARYMDRIEVFETILGHKTVTSNKDMIDFDPLYSNGARARLTTTGDWIQTTFSGISCDLIFTTSNGYSTIKVDTIKISDSTLMKTVTLDLNNGGSTIYSEQFTVVSGLPYDGYYCLVTNLQDKNADIEAWTFPKQDIFTPVWQFNSKKDISSLDRTLSDEDVRNEVVCVGKEISTTAPNTNLGSILGKSTDLDSIYNIDHAEYVGEKHVLALIEPTISDKKMLEWMSKSLLYRHHRKKNLINISVIGNPAIEVGDPIAIYSNRAGIDTMGTNPLFDENSYDIYWVENISHNIKKSSCTSQLAITSLAPAEAWKPLIGTTDAYLAKVGLIAYANSSPYSIDCLVIGNTALVAFNFLLNLNIITLQIMIMYDGTPDPDVMTGSNLFGIVKYISLGAQMRGTHTITWDGLNNSGALAFLGDVNGVKTSSQTFGLYFDATYLREDGTEGRTFQRFNNVVKLTAEPLSIWGSKINMLVSPGIYEWTEQSFWRLDWSYGGFRTGGMDYPWNPTAIGQYQDRNMQLMIFPKTNYPSDSSWYNFAGCGGGDGINAGVINMGDSVLNMGKIMTMWAERGYHETSAAGKANKILDIHGYGGAKLTNHADQYMILHLCANHKVDAYIQIWECLRDSDHFYDVLVVCGTLHNLCNNGVPQDIHIANTETPEFHGAGIMSKPLNSYGFRLLYINLYDVLGNNWCIAKPYYLAYK